METGKQNCVKLNDNGLYLENVLIDDKDIIQYFKNLAESEDLKEKLINLLKLGIDVSISVGATKNVNYVEKSFENLASNFSQKLDMAFGEKGQFSQTIKDHFGEDGKVIKEIFDPNREGSPLYFLKKELNNSLDDIKQKIGINKETEDLKNKSAGKGVDFEDQCEEKLQWIASIHSDKLERTSNTSGNITESKSGDFVLTLKNINKKIVFEMKNQKGTISRNKIQEELKECMENRAADYGIFVSKNKNSLDKGIGWFNEYDGNQLICAVESDDIPMMDGGIIHIAYKWAREKLLIEDIKDKKIDAAFIIEKTSEITKKIDELSTIKTQCTNIDNATTKVRDIVKDAEKQIKQQLENIVNSLSK